MCRQAAARSNPGRFYCWWPLAERLDERLQQASTCFLTTEDTEVTEFVVVTADKLNLTSQSHRGMACCSRLFPRPSPSCSMTLQGSILLLPSRLRVSQPRLRRSVPVCALPHDSDVTAASVSCFLHHRGHRGHRVCCCRHYSDLEGSIAVGNGLLQPTVSSPLPVMLDDTTGQHPAFPFASSREPKMPAESRKGSLLYPCHRTAADFALQPDLA